MEVTSYAPGTPSYVDLGTTDLTAAKTFYGTLFGWDSTDMPMDDQGGIYSMMSKSGKDVAGMYEISAAMQDMGVPPFWATYITVSDADAAAAAIEAAGGTVTVQPFDVFEAGRQAVGTDPTGAAFSVWQPKASIGAYLVNEHGALIWNELQTNDTEACAAFYSEVFGWSTHVTDMPNGPYTSFMLGEKAVAGMMEIQAEWGPVPPNWSIYFAIDDVDAAVAQAADMGAKLMMGPMDVPEVGRFCMLQEPQGAMFYVMTPPTG